MAVKCADCKHENPDHVVYCGRCGSPLSSPDSDSGPAEGSPQSPHRIASEAQPTAEHLEYGDYVTAPSLPPRMKSGWLSDRMRADSSRRSEIKGVVAGLMMTFGGWLVLCLLALVFGIGVVYPELETRSYDLDLFFMDWHHLVTLSGGVLQGWYLFLVCAIVASAMWVAKKSWHKFLNEVMREGVTKDHSQFFEICGLVFAWFLVVRVIVFVLEESGTSIAYPLREMEEWEWLFLLANAPVWEEIAYRVLPIGLPLIVFDVALTRRRSLWRYLTGGGVRVGKVEAFLIILSALVFGLAHVEGWGSWRVIDTGLLGMALGYVFLKYGLAAAIILHFPLDYMLAPLVVFKSSVLFPLMNLCTALWLGLGLVFAVYYTIRVAEYVSGQLPPNR